MFYFGGEIHHDFYLTYKNPDKSMDKEAGENEKSDESIIKERTYCHYILFRIILVY